MHCGACEYFTNKLNLLLKRGNIRVITVIDGIEIKIKITKTNIDGFYILSHHQKIDDKSCVTNRVVRIIDLVDLCAHTDDMYSTRFSALGYQIDMMK